MYRKIKLSLVALAVIGGFVSLTALAAGATTRTGTGTGPVCATWQMRGATGAYPAVVFGGAPAGSSVSKGTAKLVKPAEGTDPGVEFATRDIRVTAYHEVLVGADYLLGDGASSSAGAVRMFGYQAKNADTLNASPDWTATASQESGHLVFTIPAGKKLGTLGFAYDASNNTKGSVTISKLTIGEREVPFTRCGPGPIRTTSAPASTSPSPSHPGPIRTTTSPSASASTTASPSTTVSPSASTPATGNPSASTSTSPVPVIVTGGGSSLPVTGVNGHALLAGASGLLLAGTGLFFLARRRKVRYES